jgi:hypothetical protein
VNKHLDHNPLPPCYSRKHHSTNHAYVSQIKTENDSHILTAACMVARASEHDIKWTKDEYEYLYIIYEQL